MLLKLVLSLLVVTSILAFAKGESESQDSEESQESESNQDSEEYWSWGSSEEEGECGDEAFWHIRGRRCVPYICPRGNSKRNFETGECLFGSEATVSEEKGSDELLHGKWDRAVWSGFYQPKEHFPKMLGGSGGPESGKLVGKFASGGKSFNKRKMLRDKFEAWVHKMKEIDEHF